MFIWKALKLAVMPCPILKGVICITVTRLDTNQPIPDINVSVDGPTPGSKPTNPQGISDFDERDPGAYTYTVTFPSPKYKDWVIVPYTPELSVAGQQITIAEVFAYPVGKLEVRVVRDDGGGKEGVVDMAHVTASGPFSLTADAPKGTHDFTEVMCGDYDVSGSASSELYDPYQGTHLKVTVPEGGVGKALIKVVPKTWIKLRVHDVDAKTDVLRYGATLKLLDGVIGLNEPGNTGLIDLTLKRQGAKTCGVQQIDCAEDHVYEVVEVTKT